MPSWRGHNLTRNALNNLGSDHGYFLSAYLYGNHVSMLVDSGANVSI
jgi:hypothetical protein